MKNILYILSLVSCMSGLYASSVMKEEELKKAEEAGILAAAEALFADPCGEFAAEPEGGFPTPELGRVPGSESFYKASLARKVRTPGHSYETTEKYLKQFYTNEPQFSTTPEMGLRETAKQWIMGHMTGGVTTQTENIVDISIRIALEATSLTVITATFPEGSSAISLLIDGIARRCKNGELTKDAAFTVASNLGLKESWKVIQYKAGWMTFAEMWAAEAPAGR